MAILSFTFTENEFIDGCKTCTRRDWKPKQMEMWQRQWDKGNIVHDAWNKLPFAGGRFIGKFKLTCRPYWEKLADMPEKDIEAEGGFCTTVDEFIMMIGKSPEDKMAVVRFKKVT